MNVDILHGDAVTMLRTLPAGSVHVCVTSPPYWGLRDYGTAQWEGGEPGCDHKPSSTPARRGLASSGLDGGQGSNGHQQEGYRDTCQRCGAHRIDNQLGLEPVHDCLGWATGQPCGECYVCHMVDVFREVRRVLRDDGTVWINLGDSYNGSGGAGGDYAAGGLKDGQPKYAGRKVGTLKPKDLCMIPARVALALQADGWWLRSEIVWAKKAPMPESVTDRPTRSHEVVWLLSKRARYFYDAAAVAETSTNDPRGGFIGDRYNSKSVDGSRNDKNRYGTEIVSTRNARDVWTLGPDPYPEAHFATFPREIPRRAILAGTSAHGCCPTCGAGWVRVVERTGGDTEAQDRPKRTAGMDSKTSTLSLSGNGSTEWAKRGSSIVTLGWSPACDCNRGEGWYWCPDCDITAHISELTSGCPRCGKTMIPAPHEPVPAVVLDPFLGSGTTAAVAVELGRHAVGIELNQEYIELARRRLDKAQAPLLATLLEIQS